MYLDCIIVIVDRTTWCKLIVGKKVKDSAK